MHVAELLDALAVGPDIEVVVARLPEGRAGAELARRRLLENLEGGSQGAALRLADQQMDVFRHDHVAANDKPVPAADALHGLLDGAPSLRRRE